jgi:hypothetical protein
MKIIGTKKTDIIKALRNIIIISKPELPTIAIQEPLVVRYNDYKSGQENRRERRARQRKSKLTKK